MPLPAVTSVNRTPAAEPEDGAGFVDAPLRVLDADGARTPRMSIVPQVPNATTATRAAAPRSQVRRLIMALPVVAPAPREAGERARRSWAKKRRASSPPKWRST